MNKKQEILDCIKTLNLTQEQANRLADVLASGEGGSNKSVKLFEQYQEGDLTTFKVNDKEIPFTKGNEGDVGEVYLINEQDFNYIKDVIKNGNECYIERIEDSDYYKNGVFGVTVKYSSYDNIEGYIIESVNEIPLFYTLDIFRLIKMDFKYYFLF